MRQDRQPLVSKRQNECLYHTWRLLLKDSLPTEQRQYSGDGCLTETSCVRSCGNLKPHALKGDGNPRRLPVEYLAADSSREEDGLGDGAGVK